MKKILTNLLPFEDFEINSKLNPKIVKDRISSIIETKKQIKLDIFQEKKVEKPFSGKIDGDKFYLNRFHGNNSYFSPFVSADVKPFEGLAIIRVKMRLSYPVMVFMGVWLGFSGFITIMDLVLMLYSGNFNSFLTAVISPAILFIWGYAICLIGFKLDARAIRAYFEKFLNA